VGARGSQRWRLESWVLDVDSFEQEDESLFAGVLKGPRPRTRSRTRPAPAASRRRAARVHPSAPV